MPGERTGPALSDVRESLGQSSSCVGGSAELHLSLGLGRGAVQTPSTPVVCGALRRNLPFTLEVRASLVK